MSAEFRTDSDSLLASAVAVLVAAAKSARFEGNIDEADRLDRLVDQVPGAVREDASAPPATQVRHEFRIDEEDEDTTLLRRIAATVLPSSRRVDSMSVRDIAYAVSDALGQPVPEDEQHRSDAWLVGYAKWCAYSLGGFSEATPKWRRKDAAPAPTPRDQMISNLETNWTRPVEIAAKKETPK